jgi:hypothetical protein
LSYTLTCRLCRSAFSPNYTFRATGNACSHTDPVICHAHISGKRDLTCAPTHHISHCRIGAGSSFAYILHLCKRVALFNKVHLPLGRLEARRAKLRKVPSTRNYFNMYLTTLMFLSILPFSTCAAPTVPRPPICGTIHLQGGKTQVIYGDACYGITGKALSATVSEACGCDFSQQVLPCRRC